MQYELPKSKCLICDSYYTPKGIGRHIRSCVSKHFQDAIRQDTVYYLVHIHPDFSKDYFLYLLLGQSVKLRNLDSFLRSIWLECCGHMSAFFHGRFREIPKTRTISQIENISDNIFYHYDFGSTTELCIKIIGKQVGPSGLDKKIVMLARNAQPIVPCERCGEKPAVSICTQCQWSGTGWLCEDCVETHPCGEEMFLPVCNSPRAGVCGYDGASKEPQTDKLLKDFLKKLKKSLI